MYKYKAKVLDVYDGDTVTLLIDIGFSIHLKERCRLIGINTPEIRTRDLEEKKNGYIARDYLRNLILNKDVIIETHKQGKYGRYLVEIFYNDESINQKMLDKGYAEPYLVNL